MMLRMVANLRFSNGIELQRFILYTLASLVVITLPQFQSMHICKPKIQTLNTYVGGANTTNLGSWNLSISFTHGKITWASNMNPKELNFHIFVELSSITKKGKIERSLFGFGYWVTTLGGLIVFMWDTQGISPQVIVSWRSSLHMRHDIESYDQGGEDQDKAWLDGPVASVKGKS
jgi:hypothetical protein